MTTTDLSLRQIIEAALARPAGPVADATLQLWRKLAPELITIIGELGFDALYARSIRLARLRHPWIKQDASTLSGDDVFAPLQQSLQAQDATQAGLASLALFTIFFDTLALLIGEALTKHLLHSAWGKETSDIPGKNFNDD